MDGLDQALHNEIVLQNEDDGRNPIWKYPNMWIAGQKELRVGLDEEALYIRDGKILRAFQQGTFDLPAELIERLSARVQEEEPFPSEGFYFVKKFCTLDFRFRVYLYVRIPGYATDQGITVSGEYTVGVKKPARLTMDAFRGLADYWSEESHRYMHSRLKDYIEWQMTGAFTEARLGNFPLHSLKDHLSARVTSELQNILGSHGLTLLEFHIWHMDMPEGWEENYMMAQKPASAPPPSPSPSCCAKIPSENTCQKQEEAPQPAPRPAAKSGTGFLGAGINAIGSVVGMGLAVAVGAAELLQKAKNRSDSGKEKKAPLIQNVQISAVAPKKFIKGDYSMVRVLLYEEAYRHIVEAVKTTEDQEERTTAQVPENALVRVRLTSPDMEIEDDVQEAVWTGSFQEFGFAVMLPINYPKRTIQFRAMISVNGVPATRLTFVAKCSSLLEQKLRVVRQDILSAFVSYASADREDVVRVIQGMRKARPDMDIFIDVEKLRSGENWQKALYGEIDQRDLLVLCWSRSAKKSEWVDREWRYAMAQKGVDCIDPVPLEPAEICPPPSELAGKHFNDNLLYIRSGASSHWGDVIR